MQQRGWLTITQIATTILAIAGFVIVLIFLFVVLDIEEQSEDELCRLSVLTRATAPNEVQRSLPLQCTTKKICLSAGEGNCNRQFFGEKDIKEIKLPATREKAKEAARQIEEISANAMFDCWSMMGKGKLDLFSGPETNLVTNILAAKFTKNAIKPTCIICSRIAIADDLTNRDDILKEVNLNDYIKNKQVPGSTLTYLQTFTDQQIQSYPREFTQELGEHNAEKQTTDQMAFIFMQILAENKRPIEEGIEKGAHTGLALAGALLTPAGKVVRVLGVSTTAISVLLSVTLAGGIAWHVASQNQGLAAIQCDKFTSTQENRYGCSIVTPIDYNNITAINLLCTKIEGNP